MILLLVIAGLLAYIIFTLMFMWLFRDTYAGQQRLSLPTAEPTFTAAIPTATTLIVAENNAPATPTLPVPAPPIDSLPLLPPTNTPVAETIAPAPNTPTPAGPQIIAATGVNIRSGPGTNYAVLGQLSAGQSLPVVARNEAATWWQVPLPDGSFGWVSASVVKDNGPFKVPVAQAPPLPTPAEPPTATPAPLPQFQYEPTGWYAATNYGLTRFLGSISEANGNPVNGVSVEAQCADFKVISNPSGPVGWPPFYDSASDPPGFYDITLDTRPIACVWVLTVVDSPDGKTVTARMSDAIQVETTVDSSIVTANWRKNW